MNKPYRQCKYPGCTDITKESYCVKHYKKNEAYEYDRNRRDKESKRFYTSVAWLKCRDMALVRDNYLCQKCFIKGILTPAKIVHHKKELKYHSEEALSVENLICLCTSCHNKIHRKKS